MELREDEIIQKYGKQCGHCNQNTLFPYECEWSCLSCGFNLTKRKHEFTNKQRKKLSLSTTNMQNKKYFVFVLMYKKFMKVMIMIKHLKLYQH